MDIVYELLATLFDAVLAFSFLKRMTKARLSVWFFVGISAHFISTTLLTFVNTFSVLPSIINLLIMFTYTLTLKNTTWFQKIIYPVMFDTILILVNTLFMFVTSWIFNVEISVVLSRGITQRYVGMVLSKVILFTVSVIVIRLKNKKAKFSLFDFLIYVVLPAASIFELYVLISIGMVYDLDKFTPYVIGAIIAIFVINVFSYLMFKRLSESLYETYELKLYQQQVDDEKKQYTEMNDNYQKICKIRHDINKQIDSISALVYKGDGGTAEEALTELKRRVDSITGSLSTGNPTIDFIINSKLNDHKDLNLFLINSSINVDRVDPLDLASLIGNIIDNALEALENSTEKRLEIDFSTSDDYQSIIIKNSIDSSVLETNPDLDSTKKDKVNHGLGTKIIRDITEKYEGICSFFEKNGMFGVHVMIPIRREE
ncbi:MAG: GHKL domain-containing protein [Clostridia bacterium]|nr:GHKL domain-containing protein [Clostridia bacterium]